MSNNFFSLEFSEKYIKIIDLKKTDNNQYEIDYIGKINIVDGFYTSDLEDKLILQSEEIKKIISSLGINKKNVTISLSDNFAYHQIIEMPILKEKELISAIKYQADQFIPIPVQEANIDLEIIKEDKKNKKLSIFVVAASKKIIEKIQNTIELSGFIPESIETQTSSLSRFVSSFYKEILNNYSYIKDFLIINLNNSFSNFCYFDENPIILKKIYDISIGYDLFLKEIMINLNLNKEKSINILKNYKINQQSSYPVDKIINPILNEFILEINRFFAYKKPSGIFFVGNIMDFPSLIDLLTINLKDKTPVSIINPMILFKKNSILETLKDELPFYFSVMGTNLR
ncbi:MAG: pilus assembly protein PilM [Patescibacteria group bacterium]|nr:pilus assembly protein PilM [Patescibacteria group bacterium]